MQVDHFLSAKWCWDTGWSVGLPQKKNNPPAKVALQSENTEVLIWRRNVFKGICKKNLVRFPHPSWIKQVVMRWNCSRICSSEALDAETGFQAIRITKTDCRDTLENAGMLIWFDLQLWKKNSGGGMYSWILNSSLLITNSFFQYFMRHFYSSFFNLCRLKITAQIGEGKHCFVDFQRHLMEESRAKFF